MFSKFISSNHAACLLCFSSFYDTQLTFVKKTISLFFSYTNLLFKYLYGICFQFLLLFFSLILLYLLIFNKFQSFKFLLYLPLITNEAFLNLIYTRFRAARRMFFSLNNLRLILKVICTKRNLRRFI